MDRPVTGTLTLPDLQAQNLVLPTTENFQAMKKALAIKNQYHPVQVCCAN